MDVRSTFYYHYPPDAQPVLSERNRHKTSISDSLKNFLTKSRKTKYLSDLAKRGG
jgi:hypothetical protein